jgi:SAM-dependent methyltransferase
MARQERLSIFLGKERDELAQIIQDCQGFAGLIVNGHEPLNLPFDRIQHVFTAGPKNSNANSCNINYTEMPFGNEFFDVIILNHIFDEVDEIMPVLTEAKRILRHDGVLLINGFERMRLCARVMQRRFAKKTCITRKRYGILDIQARLTELDFQIETHYFDFCKNPGLEKCLKYIVPFLGIGFWIKAQKQVAPLSPLPKNSWELKPILAPLANPEYLTPQKQELKNE